MQQCEQCEQCDRPPTPEQPAALHLRLWAVGREGLNPRPFLSVLSAKTHRLLVPSVDLHRLEDTLRKEWRRSRDYNKLKTRADI